ncbi:SpoIID/LytB domain-containing protein [Metabacillus niabensis]|uniref:SpoIID/LytB domain protein n=1 Tax=Metabacillus niabensis TaxID=324854 RepID=A0ABT9Z4I0_9BACI|nr:SpoIID/LytB domain-containing protein [Metabacillus niabensis]MDQ0227169.1 SpoIID/LytB domain protein [Metabacillus niabensis]
MQKLIKIALAVVLALSILQISPIVNAASEPNVTVELRNYIGNKTSLDVKLSGEYKTGNTNNDNLIKSLTSFTLKVENKKLVLYVNNTKKGIVEGNLVLTPTNYATSYVQINDPNNTDAKKIRKYRGSFEFKVASEKYVRPYNTLPLEDYIKGVVPEEMLASWDREALKAQAVAARSKAAKLNYKLNDTQGNQVYGGLGDPDYATKISEVVDATEGKILKYGSSVADTVYTSSNGGYIESAYGAWGQAEFPYLIAKEDSFDPKQRWTVDVQSKQISLDGYDLNNPGAWWSSIQEADAIARNSIKPWLKTQVGLPSTSDLKILSIDDFSINPERTPGKRIKSGKIKIQYVVKDAQNNVSVKTYAPTSISADQIRSMFGSMTMRSTLVDQITSPTSTDIQRINGDDRIETSIEISKELYPNGFSSSHPYKTVFIATRSQYADALSAGPLAYQYGNAPILLTDSKSLSTKIVNEITRLKATNVIVLGGNTAVSDTVVQQIKQINTIADNNVQRVYGDNRYETNAEINKRLKNIAGTFVASGEDFADALASSSIAALNNYAIVLTRASSLPAVSKTFISTHASKPAYVLGGPVAVSATAYQQVQHVKSNVARLSGSNRYGTLAALLEKFKGSFSGTDVIYATGTDFPDALTSSSLSAAKKAPLILVGADLSTKLDSFLTGYKQSIKTIHVLGGTVAVDEEKVSQLKDKLGVITTLHLSGLGFGHGVGMSQYGAQKQAREGYTYAQILKFYYPNTNLTDLY